MDASPSEFLTLNETAAALEITRVRVRQLVIAGKITPKDKKFARKDVEALRKVRGGSAPRTYTDPRTEASIALRAFELFKAGRTLQAIMGELQLTPQRVRVLYREYVTPLGGKPPPSDDDRDREAEETIEVFQRDQAARRVKNDREHQERMRELEDLRATTKKGSR